MVMMMTMMMTRWTVARSRSSAQRNFILICNELKGWSCDDQMPSEPLALLAAGSDSLTFFTTAAAAFSS